MTKRDIKNYEYVSKEVDGLRRIKMNNRFGIMNSNGEELGKGCIYIFVSQVFNGFVFVLKKINLGWQEKWGFVDREGNEYDIIYDKIDFWNVSKGICWCEKDGKEYLVNPMDFIIKKNLKEFVK